MDPKTTKALVERVCAELSLRNAKRALRPLGLALALSAGALGCGDEDEPRALYAAPPDSVEADGDEDATDVVPDEGADTLYAAPDSVDLYGIWDATPDTGPDTLYGGPDDLDAEPDEIGVLYGDPIDASE